MKKLLDIRAGQARMRLFKFENPSGPHIYPIPPSAWRRAIALVKVMGSEAARYKIDERAMRAYDRGDSNTARRWRDLLVAIHAIELETPLGGEPVH